MGYQIIQQSDGVYAVFSSAEGHIVLVDATAEETLDWFILENANQRVEDTRRNITRILADLADGHPERAYPRFVLTWEQTQRKDREHGGDYSRGAFIRDTDPQHRYVVVDADHLRASLAKLHPTIQARMRTTLNDLAAASANPPHEGDPADR